ncbi:gliding motility-associated C-terminal domain-containing protein [Lewinella sp. JB7]|uniref:T9SS type B sorting domain-containing protein n=1 Tax=Lewinella sp. JB7 TaxID=2962887 RepID=UPI0020C93CCA|nr:gliding motility-associated C-terminal domain-containing protein [Lewinella sp. JB7]MCP9234460.1 gliding motility-associated C-terminal domain-containing protein [Lewinella sp. JB7]
MNHLYLLGCALLLATGLFAQPVNDDCGGAIALPRDPVYCSGPGAFSTGGATTSLEQEEYAICLDERTEIKDVWFSFVATRNSVSIQVTGAVPGNQRGTIEQPQFALLSGSCDNFTNVACRSPFVSGGQIQNGGSLIYNNLQRGQTYYVLVGARNGNSGTFELCVEQFDAVPDPSSDCGTAVLLCDKSSFAVESLQGNGQVDEDLLATADACNGSSPAESNSSWYKWTCDEAGTLEFTITPLGAAPNEDIDFVVYELPGGLDACNDRRVLRQMYSGETSGNGQANIPCLGPTGLSAADPDQTEGCGCTPGNNNFAQAIDMEAGKSYALVIMNFTSSGDGFSIEFGGSGTFLGPEPNLIFSSAEACVGESVTFQDQSTSVDGIASWSWDFGPTATPRTASGAGPHEVFFTEPGEPNVSLAITTNRNCVEYVTASEFSVVCCADQYSAEATVGNVSCAGAADGSIDLTGRSRIADRPLSYRWSTGATTAAIDGLDLGDYTVTLTDGTGCEATFTYTVGGAQPFVFDTLITQPDCAGGTNGALEFRILSGGGGGYEYSFNGGAYSSETRIENLPVSTINVRARDANGCEVEQNILVDELQLELIEGAATFTEPTCNGEATGSITINVANGTPAYGYDFGDGYQSAAQRGGFAAGTYRVDVVDAEGCTGAFDIEVTEPPPLEVNLQADSSSCFAANDGSIFATGVGGRPGYTFAWADGTTGADRVNLPAGTFTVSLTDSLGCTVTDSVTLNDPEEIVATIVEQADLICFGQPVGSFTLAATGGSPDYMYSSNGQDFQEAPRLEGLVAGDYTLYVRDLNGCIDSVAGSLSQPEEFVIDVADRVRLFLGNDTTLLARSNYFPVTFSWGPDSVACLTPDCARVRVMPLVSGDYFVTGVNPAGCVDTALVNFLVIEDLPIFIPNAFTPNGDDDNDHFTVFGGRALGRIEAMRVYDRWGGLVYEAAEPFPANEPELGWDGTVNGTTVNGGVYVYVVEVSYINGRRRGYRGDVTVVR